MVSKALMSWVITIDSERVVDTIGIVTNWFKVVIKLSREPYPQILQKPDSTIT